MSLKKSKSGRAEKVLSVEEQQHKINEVRKLIGPLSDEQPKLCSDASISRFLRARNWNVEKANKMLKETLKWRLQYRPELIRWEDVAPEAMTGKTYRTDYHDKNGRTVLVMRPGFQNTSSVKGQIKYLIYCMENAILNMAPGQEQMVWLIDFQGWTMGSVSVKAARETAHVLQDYYPERLGCAILYNPPKIFESFAKVVKPFIEQKTYKKVSFVYSDNPASQKILLDLFDMDKLEAAFGGHNQNGFNFERFASRMREDDQKMAAFLGSGCLVSLQERRLSESSLSDSHSDGSVEASLSSDASSTKSGGNQRLHQNGSKRNGDDEAAHQIRDVGTKESI